MPTYIIAAALRSSERFVTAAPWQPAGSVERGQRDGAADSETTAVAVVVAHFASHTTTTTMLPATPMVRSKRPSPDPGRLTRTRRSRR